ncbi:MAG: glycerol acyltransferase, partial [Saprospiraceae bacterium]|nr:glycerol acyltransferase [Saprospiraceae bacterium]
MNKLPIPEVPSEIQFPMPPVFEQIEDWPISKMHQEREDFVKALEEFVLQKIMAKPIDVVNDWIAKSIYLERIRIKEEPWKVDLPDENVFWKKIRKQLSIGSLDKPIEQARVVNEDILRKIISRYSQEIVGTFNQKTFLFARRFLTVFFGRLLNTAAGRNLGRFWGTKHRLYERFKIRGEVETLRSLFSKGSVIVVPTHSSNLDSIMIGYTLDQLLALPSFFYGAGLNLYNTGYTAYFMNRLGAYRVDRRKKNPIYLETLKGNSKLAIEYGTNSLFFPGGTRSRSGELEQRLKLGLMGTVVEAQRALCQKEGNKEKVFVVPLILSYHFVLEAKYLIEGHLKRTGKEQFISRPDAGYSRRKILKFVWELFSKSSDITLSFGKPMDALGNFVDKDGRSFDKYGNEIDIKDYFFGDGLVGPNLQREGEYTKILANRVVERFRKDNVVLNSHLLAYTVFQMLQADNKKLDIFGLLRLPPEDYLFEFDEVLKGVSLVRDKLMELEAEGEIK